MFPNDGFTPIFQVILCFASGLLFSTISYGFYYFILFLIIFKLITIINNFQNNIFFYYLNAGCVLSSFMGFIIGRIIMGDEDPLRYKYIRT